MGLSIKRGFTLIEILIACVLLGIGISGVVVVITNGLAFVQDTRQRVIAVNIAREGMEQMYQIRDTNWQRWAGKKEQCRLKKDPLVDENLPGCEDDARITSGWYAIMIASGVQQEYFFLSGGEDAPSFSIDDGVQQDEKAYSLCSIQDRRIACPGQEPIDTQGAFLRAVHVLGLFDKNMPTAGGAVLDCDSGQGPDPDCGQDTAKELRFCVIGAFAGGARGDIELCGLVTNFDK